MRLCACYFHFILRVKYFHIEFFSRSYRHASIIYNYISSLLFKFTILDHFISLHNFLAVVYNGFTFQSLYKLLFIANPNGPFVTHFSLFNIYRSAKKKLSRCHLIQSLKFERLICFQLGYA